MGKSPADMAAAMIKNMKEKTGKTLPQWVKIAKASKLQKHGEIIKFLKTEHEMTHGFANLVAMETLSKFVSAPAAEGDLVEIQYAGDKAALRPTYNALIAAVKKFGKDVEIAPKKAYVSLRRNKQFGLIQPATKTRIDVGINLKGAKVTDRLEKSGSFNSMVSHRVRVTDKKEVDRELIAWLEKAYQDA